MEQWLRSLFILTGLVFILFLGMKKEQNTRLNWALSYSGLYVAITLCLIHPLLVKWGYWHFTEEPNRLGLPLDIAFIWWYLWGVFPFYFLRKYSVFLLLLVAAWIDFLSMPVWEKAGLLVLSKNWWKGELLLLFFVIAPAFLWAKAYYYRKWRSFRAVMQLLMVAFLFFYLLPMYGQDYVTYKDLLSSLNIFWAALAFILGVPGVVALIDLVQLGRGTPFPYDPTQRLVQTGVYAYCRNPIQWSFAILFLVMAIMLESIIILAGCLVAVVYCEMVNRQQEKADMKNRFGSAWDDYQKNKRFWFWTFYTKSIPLATVICPRPKKWEKMGLYHCQFIEGASWEYSDGNGLKVKGKHHVMCLVLAHKNIIWAYGAWWYRFLYAIYLFISKHLRRIFFDELYSKNRS